MRLLSAIDEQILRRLAHYKFLTLSQLVKLRTGEKSYVSSRLKLLRDDGYVGVSQYGGVYKKGEGRAENINYLLPKGVKLLAENFQDLSKEEIHYPKNVGAFFRNDYFHRISTVNVQVAYELWLEKQGYNKLFFQTYFHKVGSAKKSKDDPLKSITRIELGEGKFIEPDAIFAYETNDKKQLLVLEVSNGADVSRIVEQLKKVCGAVSMGLVTKMYLAEYGIEKSPRILCTVETEDMLRLVLKRINSDVYFSPAWMAQAFFFQVAEKIWDEFDAYWLNMNGEISIFL